MENRKDRVVNEIEESEDFWPYYHTETEHGRVLTIFGLITGRKEATVHIYTVYPVESSGMGPNINGERHFWIRGADLRESELVEFGKLRADAIGM